MKVLFFADPHSDKKQIMNIIKKAKKADLGVGKLFLAPIGKIEKEKMSKHYCNNCETEFPNPPKIQPINALDIVKPLIELAVSSSRMAGFRKL